MPALFVVFLAAAWLNELVLAVGLAKSSEARRDAISLAVTTGSVLLLMGWMVFTTLPGSNASAPILPTRAMNFLFALGLSSLLFQLATGRRQVAQLQGALQLLRISLPLLAGSLAVLASSAGGIASHASTTLALCLGLPIMLALLSPVTGALLDRLQLSATPALLRGLPITLLSAVLVALGLTGLIPVLPW